MFGGYIFGVQDFFVLLYILINKFLSTTKFGESQKFGALPQMPPVATGLTNCN